MIERELSEAAGWACCTSCTRTWTGPTCRPAWPAPARAHGAHLRPALLHLPLLKRGASMSKYVSGLKVMTRHFPSVEPYARFFQSEDAPHGLAAHFGRDSSLTIAAFLRLDAPSSGTPASRALPFAEAEGRRAAHACRARRRLRERGNDDDY